MRRRLFSAHSSSSSSPAGRHASALPFPVLSVKSSSSEIFRRLRLLSLSPSSLSTSPLHPPSVFVEGRTLIGHLSRSRWPLLRLCLSHETLGEEERRRGGEGLSLLDLLRPSPLSSPSLLLFPSSLFSRLSSTVHPSEYGAEFLLPPALPLLSSVPTVLLDGVSDPSNVGSIVRSCHAFGFRQLLLRSPTARPFSQKAIAASAGSLAFVRVGLWEGEGQRLLREGREKSGVTLVGLSAREGLTVEEVRDRGRKGGKGGKGGAVFWLAVGNESRGLSEEVQSNCDTLCRIPLHEEVESLNAAVATAIAAYHLQ